MYSCGGCENRWGGLAQAHCSQCHQLFSGITSFDRHRRNGKCLDPAKIKNADGELVLELRTNGVTPVWAFPTDIDYNERFARSGA